MTVLHVITGLGFGGAEAMLAKLAAAGLPANMAPAILSMMTPGPVTEQLKAAGAPIHTLGMRQSVPSVLALARLNRIARELRPDLIQGWMHHGNLAATLASWSLRPRPPVVWNVRHSLSDISLEKPLVRAVLRSCGLLARKPDAIVYNSRVAVQQYAALGHPVENAVVIPNGFDCAKFAPSMEARARLCQEFGIDPATVVVGMVARWHPMKSPETLVEAVRSARLKNHDLHLLIAGTGMESPPPELAALQAMLPADRLTTVGHRTDVHAWLPGLDILALPSAWGEGFPNILGEAMACGVPCITTDIGDSGWVVGHTGCVVPARDVEAMAEALCHLASIGENARRQLGQAARSRVVEYFSLPSVAERYAALYAQVLDRTPRTNRRDSLRRAERLLAVPTSRNSEAE